MTDAQRYAYVVFDDGPMLHLLGSMYKTSCGLTWRMSDVVPGSWDGATLDDPDLCSRCRQAKERGLTHED